METGYYVIAGCLHFPYQNKGMYNCMLQLMHDIKPTRTIILGDGIDLHSMSSHNIGSLKWTDYDEETSLTNELLDLIPGNVTYMYGNHEQRVKKMQKNNEIAKYSIPDLSKKLLFEQREWEVLDDWQTARYQLGDLTLLHGVWTSANACKKHVDELNESCVFAHTHRMGAYYENKFSGYNIGWGGDKNHKAFNYIGLAEKSKWINGFMVIYLDENNNTHVQQIEYKDGFFFNGRLYRA